MEILDVLKVVGGVLVGLFLLVLMVVVHELGHAIAARRNGVVVEEFGIGFPPRAWAKKLKNNVLFTLNWLPLGGFVKLQGENDSANKKGDFGAASFWVKTKILLAGVLINWISAAIIFSGLAITGLPQLIPNQFQTPGDTREIKERVQIASISDDSPAEAAGLRHGDRLLRFDGLAIESPQDLSALTEENRGQEVEIIYSRDNVERSTDVTLNEESNGEGYLGVGPAQQTILKSTWSAPIVGLATTAQLSLYTLQELGKTLGNLVVGVAGQLNIFSAEAREAGSERVSAAGNAVAGPVGILGIIFPAAVEAGPTALLLLTAIISMTLGLMNALPIPALDGGRFAVMAVFRVLKRPLTKEREENIHATGFMVLIGLVVLVTIADVGRFF